MTEPIVDLNHLFQYLGSKMLTLFQAEKGEFIKYITNFHPTSPKYEPQWETKGTIKAALDYLSNYITEKQITNITGPTLLQQKNRSPALTFSVPPTDENETYTILLYSHIDTIPIGEGWKFEQGRYVDQHLYGRGVANGAYSVYSIVNLIKGLQAQEQAEKEEERIKLPRIVVLIDTYQESDSTDLSVIAKKLNCSPNLIFCLEGVNFSSTAFNAYSSMRGRIEFDLEVQTITRAVHSGKFGGLAPDSQMILNQLLNKIESVDMTNLKVSIPELEVDITEEQYAEATAAKNVIGEDYYESIPTDLHTEHLGTTFEETYLAHIYRPCLNIYKQYDIPDTKHPGANLRKSTTLRLSFKVPPTVNVDEAATKITTLLTQNVPYDATVTISNLTKIQGQSFNVNDKLKELYPTLTTKFPTSFNAFIGGSGDTMIYANELLKAFPDAQLMSSGLALANLSNIRNINENIVQNNFLFYTVILGGVIGYFSQYKL